MEVLEELELKHEIPRQIREWRQLMKLKGTYIDALPQLVHPQTGRVLSVFLNLDPATANVRRSRRSSAKPGFRAPRNGFWPRAAMRRYSTGAFR